VEAEWCTAVQNHVVLQGLLSSVDCKRHYAGEGAIGEESC
jgi:hypothetical protein